MDNREKVDSGIGKAILKEEDITNEELWDAGILLLTSSFENTRIR